MVQQVLGKLNSNEKMASIGAGLAILAFLLGAVTYGGYAFGISGILGVAAPIALLVIYYLKYSNPAINWPAPVATIALAIGLVEGVGALLGLIAILQWLGYFGFAVTWLLGPIVNIAGGAMMAWFTYQEWQANKGVAPAAPAPVAPPVEAPPVAPSATPAPPPAAPAADDTTNPTDTA